MEILILRAGALGDFVLSLPALACVRARFPEARITLAGYPRIAVLAREAGLVDALDRVDRVLYAPLFADVPQPTPALCDFARRFDLAVVIWRDPPRRIARGLRAAGVPRTVHVEPIPEGGERTHSIPYMLRQLPYRGGGFRPAIEGRPLEEHLPDGDVLAIHPGSGGRGADRNWPPERFAEIANRRRPCVVVEGPADGESVSHMLDACAPPKPPVLRGLTVPQLAWVLQRANAYVGNDSGVTHLAAALGTRTVAVFGVTDEAIWRPAGRDVRLLKRVPINAIAVDEVLAALDG